MRALPDTIDVIGMLEAEPDERERLASRAEGEVPLSEVRLLAPLYPPSIRDFSVFEQHGEGTVMAIAGPDARIQDAWYEGPACYFSNPHAITGPEDEIAAPPGSTALDLELEVAAIIGRRGRNVPVADAGAFIAGYTVLNDWSARDIQRQEARLPFGFCKAKDFANTLGPWIVTTDELERYRADERLDLEMRALINGVELGSDTLASMAWSFEELVVFSSRGAWIAPGDVIGSGTCGGGCLFEFWGRNQRQEPPPLQPGDEVTLEVQGIGRLRNRVGEPQASLPPLPRAAAGR